MSIAAVQPWNQSFHEELPLNQISDYPLLSACHLLWCEGGLADRLPGRLDPVELPRRILPTVLLLDFEGPRPQLRIRLAGTSICDKHGSELRGRTPEQWLEPEDAWLLAETARSVAERRRPSLARRSHVAIGDRLWSYVHLVLPLARGGAAVDSLFSAMDPSTLRRVD